MSKKLKGEEGSNSMDRISELPQEILQRILYFLSQRDAVRTSVLSKSWRNIWCTRPNLNFSVHTFNGNKQEFLSVVNSTLQRYWDQRSSVEEFQLCLSLGHSDKESVMHLEKWIPTLTNMGTKKFCCSIDTKYRHLKLPPIVFGAESLQYLYLEGFMLDRKAIERIALLKHLQTLCLEDVCIEGDEIFQTIITSCPLIETLFVQACSKRLGTIKLNDLHNLRYLSFYVYNKPIVAELLCSIEIHPLSIETINISTSNINIRFHKGADFRNLKHLHMCGVDSSLDHVSSCKFPSLEYLKFSRCDGLKGIHLFIDAPNIRTFIYGGDFVPSIFFATKTSCQWHSDIDITYRHSNNDASSWFLKLKELLKSLSQSQITLRIHHYSMGIMQENILVEDNGYNKPSVVERLYLNCDLSYFSVLLYGVISICRPRNIGNYRNRKFVGLLWKILMHSESGNKDQFTQLLFRDLKLARLEIKECNREDWRRPTLSEYLRKNQDYLECRFVLEWRETPQVLT